MGAVVICTDVEVAARQTRAGADVVLILPEGLPLSAGRFGPGRLAVFVGGAGEDLDGARATAMGAELFGA